MTETSPVPVRVSVAMIVLVVVFTLLRFWARILKCGGDGFQWDDAFALILLALCLVISSVSIAWAHVGLGEDMDQIIAQGPHGFESNLKYLIWGTFAYDLSISAAKFSALFFYKRFFGLNNGKLWWTIALWVSFALSAAWLIFAIFLTIFQCSPVSGAWDKTIQPPPKCLPPFNFFVATSTTNFINDLIIVMIPIPLIIQLNMGWLKKLLAAAVLLCGYLTVFMTIGQLVVTVNNANRLEQDYMRFVEPIIIWGMVQPPVALISLSLPSALSLSRRASRFGVASLFQLNSNSDLLDRYHRSVSRPTGDADERRPESTVNSDANLTRTLSSSHASIPRPAPAFSNRSSPEQREWEMGSISRLLPFSESLHGADEKV